MSHTPALKGLFTKHIIKIALQDAHGLFRTVDRHVHLLFTARHYDVICPAHMICVAVGKNNSINPINFVSVNLIYEIGTEIEL